MRSTKVALLGSFAVLAMACTSVTIPSIPPINIPSLPPIIIPSIPPVGPTTAPGSGVPAAQSACRLVTQEEMNTVFGGTATIEPSDDGSCSITPPDSLLPVIIRYGSGETIAAGKVIIENGVELTIGGSPAYYGELLGGILYIEKAGQTLVLQAPLSTELKDKMIAIANIAITRFP